MAIASANNHLLPAASPSYHLLQPPDQPSSCSSSSSSSCFIPSLKSSPTLRLCLPKPPSSKPKRGVAGRRTRPWNSRAEAATSCRGGGGGGGFEDQAGRFAEEARRKFEGAARSVSEKAERVFSDAGQKFNEFQEKSDLEGKAQSFARQANVKLEELAYNLRKQVEKWDREYKLSESCRQLTDNVVNWFYDADQQFGIRQKARTWTSQLQVSWPRYRRQLTNFLETPIGKFFSTCFFLWFFLSGWLFRVVFFSMWILPFAAPLLIGTISRNAIVEGSCPACKTRFIGSRSQVVLCRSCRNVVWQPRQDFSKDSSDPSVIDVDFEEK